MKGSSHPSLLARRQETWVLQLHTTRQETAETMKSFMAYHKTKCLDPRLEQKVQIWKQLDMSPKKKVDPGQVSENLQ